MVCQRKKRSAPGAFTLLELLLVLALLAIAVAVAWPSLDAWLRSQRLQLAGERVRIHWVKSRSQAMEEGRPVRFTVLDSRRFRLETEPSQLLNSTVVEETLPEDVHFAGWQGEPVSSQERAVQPLGSEGHLVFGPDGRARFLAANGTEWPTVGLLLRTQSGKVMHLQIRGLTGVVTARMLTRHP